jgi:L-lactate dehydrogenase
MRRAVADTLHVNVADVRGYNMGEHGESQFTAWSTVRVNNEPIAEYAKVDYDQLADDARAGGWKIYQAKHYTSYGIATIATEMTQAIISDAHRIFPCANYDPEFGIAIGHPAMIGKQGVIKTPTLKLTDEERAKYVHSAGIIKDTFEKMK